MKQCTEKRRLSLQHPSEPSTPRPTYHSIFTRRITSPLLETQKEDEEGAQTTKTKQKCRVVVMGSAKVGKTAVVSQFLYDTFTSRYVRTVEDLHTGEYEIRGRSLQLEILDTSGAYQFPAMRRLSITTSDGFILVFSPSEPGSFQQVEQLRSEIITVKNPCVPIVVVANKCDLEESDTMQLEDIRQRVESEWRHGFVETSAKLSTNVVKVFKELLSQANVQYDLSPAVIRRRQSLPVAQLSSSQLAHLRNINRRQAKRSSCVIS